MVSGVTIVIFGFRPLWRGPRPETDIVPTRIMDRDHDARTEPVAQTVAGIDQQPGRLQPIGARTAQRHGPARRRQAQAELLHRSEEPTSELQSLMRISYAVSCLKKNT